MAKMGRPIAENPKSRTIGVRFTEEEYQRLKKYAAKNKTTAAQVLHKGMHILLDSK